MSAINNLNQVYMSQQKRCHKNENIATAIFTKIRNARGDVFISGIGMLKNKK